jgi:hypothetical protein
MKKKEINGCSQFIVKAACAACLAELTSAIPNPPAIKAPTIATNLRD